MSLNREEIANLINAVSNARKEVIRALKEQLPEGSTIECTLKSGQKRPTAMVVDGYNGDGYIRAFMPSARGRLGRFYRDVHINEIVGPIVPK